jgi:hypothetical protein
MSGALSDGRHDHNGPATNRDLPLDASPFDVIGACTQDLDRWMTATDATKAVCRGCLRRWLCARDAVETPGRQRR